LGKLQQVTLYRALENGKLFLTSGQNKKTTTIKLESFTLIACTNFPEYLLKPLQDRFKMTLPFTWYSENEIETILKNRVVHLKWYIEEEVYAQTALRSRGTPRIALKILESTRRTARANGDHNITLQHLYSTLQMEGIDCMGLTIDERKYLSIVNDHNNLIRLNVIATCLGMSSRSVSTNLEPYLIRIGVLTKDPRNGCRVLTEKGIQHITDNPVE
jgi:Holliday junction DNA helicase RuvB